VVAGVEVAGVEVAGVEVDVEVADAEEVDVEIETTRVIWQLLIPLSINFVGAQRTKPHVYPL
jgi:hypothetical protein